MLKVCVEVLLWKRCYSSLTPAENVLKAKSFRDTVFLPKSSFPGYLEAEKVVERDREVQEKAGFKDYYCWQRQNLKGKEFVLHDGPPYANGKPHIGHAINKILKDIILRSHLVRGNRVHFIPGWDCHGLPIEMFALKNVKEKLSPIDLRQKARNSAKSMSSIQMEAFKSWGVLGDWEKQCYYTFDTKYVIHELQAFWKLVEKGLIYYDLKPVFWSPSSKTALAEAELVYKDHKSTSLIVRFEVTGHSLPEPLFLLVWTTTPWTLPLNEAVYCSPCLKYSIVKISSFPGFYIVASGTIETLQKKLEKNITEHSVIAPEEIIKLEYKHPWNKEKIKKIFDSQLVELSGTGLLHSVPGHGHDDYILGLERKLKVKCYVDESGCFTAAAGLDLAEKDVLGKGSLYVTEKLQSDILLKELYSHSYPYDWRTNEPVIIRPSKQWFIDCGQLKERALESLKDLELSHTYFQSKLKDRPYWCLSRQRTWGVPIPTFYHKISGRPLLSKNLIHHLCQLIDLKGSDVWWTEDLEVLFPKKFYSEFFVESENVVKGKDIMDIWFDSGISWSCVLEGKKSELYLEGVDQYSGWFQSSLLTGIALANEAPFKKILVHGFAVDEKGRKMSKSLGNVTDPETVVRGENALGVDALRWWVGGHSHHNLVPASNSILKLSFDDIKKFRMTLRFLLGALEDVTPEVLESCDNYGTLDRFLLNSCCKFYNSVMNFYDTYEIQKVCSEVNFFVTNQISSRYIAVIKDRLYCDAKNSVRRRSCQYTINGILLTLSHSIAPILPHLAEEVYLHHPVYAGVRKLFYNKSGWSPPRSWNDTSADQYIELIDKIKKEISQEKKLQQKICCIEMDKKNIELLKQMQEGRSESADSELTEMLQVAKVRLQVGSNKYSLLPTDSFFCPRCRRYTALKENHVCERCETIVSGSKV